MSFKHAEDQTPWKYPTVTQNREGGGGKEQRKPEHTTTTTSQSHSAITKGHLSLGKEQLSANEERGRGGETTKVISP